MDRQSSQRAGLLWGLAAFLLWGVFVFYFKAVAHVPPLEIMAHRILWSAPLLWALAVTSRRRRAEIRGAFNARTLTMLVCSTALIAVNWYTFIWAVTNDQVLQASLGYYINPLVNVVLGLLFLGERLTPRQRIAVGLAAAAVALLVVAQGRLPVIALLLALTFGFYGLLRKTVSVGPLVGLSIEVSLLLPLAGAYLAWLIRADAMTFRQVDLSTDLLILSAGAVTAVPLLCFAAGARRLDYATMGLLQYIAPSLQFLIAVAVYHEPLRPVQGLAFGLIWTALAIYSHESWRQMDRRGRSPVSSTDRQDGDRNG